MDRRNFLKLMAAGATTLAAGLPAIAAAGSRQVERIGVQLYTVRSLMEKSVTDTLKLVAATGYDEVEFAGYYGQDPKALRALLDDLGLKAPATHVDIATLRDKLPQVIEVAHVLGHSHIVLPYLKEEDRVSLDQYKAHAALLNKAGEASKAAGLTMAYHNHDFEFAAIDGTEPYDILLHETDAGLVKMEMDLFWATKAGRDPVDYFKRSPGRFPLWHVKDMAANGDMVDVGQGQIDFVRFYAAADIAGLKHAFVENDIPADPKVTLERGVATLRGLRY